MITAIYFLLGLQVVICIVLICLCIDSFWDVEDDLAPPPCHTADWQAIERQARAVQDQAQAELKTRPRSPPHAKR